MNEELHKRLIADIESLRKLISECSTETIVGMCSAKLARWHSGDGEPSPLMSPVKQVFFLLGLMLTSPEPADPKDFGDVGFDESLILLNRMFLSYAEMYWPEDGELANMPKEWRHRREVSMAAFLHYFNVLMIASVEQLRDRIQRYLVPLDDEIEELTGLRASTVLEVADWIVEQLQKGADELGNLQPVLQTEYKARLELLQKAEDEGWDLERLRDEFLSGKWASASEQIMSTIDNLMKFDPSDLEGRFGTQVAESYLALFKSRRGEIEELKYPTELNPAERKPFFELPDGRLICPFANMLYIAANEVLEDILRSSEHNQAFLRHRDRTLETHVANEFARLFSEASLFLENVYETPERAYEHDLVILWKSILLVVEAKASPPIEPFRDPEKAFVRIRDSFRSNTGIQKGFSQALRLQRKLEGGTPLELFDSHGREVASITTADVTETHLVCITRDDFGVLAADLSFLLEKELDDPFPWAANILDLAYLIDTWQYFRWGPEELLCYLRDRRRLHGLVISSDELEMAGFFVEHGGLEHLLQRGADRILLSIRYSDVLDKVYATAKGGPPVHYSPSLPYFTNLPRMCFEFHQTDPVS